MITKLPQKTTSGSTPVASDPTRGTLPKCHRRPLLSWLLLLPLLLASDLTAQDDPVLPDTPFDYTGVVLPNHFRVNGPGPRFTAPVNIDNTPANNIATNDGITLGRVLFYEKKLSRNGTVSCASCHHQDMGFSDPERFSVGFEGETTPRHSMGLSNARFFESGRFFWDERAPTLEDQTITPIQDHIEMGLTVSELEILVSAQPYYGQLFTNAFGDPSVTTDRISRALAQFVRSLVSATSRYDQARAEVANPAAPFPSFTDSENLGKSIFLNTGNQRAFSCIECHETEAFVADNPTNNGLDATFADLGVGGINGRQQDIGRFKVPSLRNIAVRPPFMHDGRFTSLEQVVEHYNSGIQNSPSLDRDLRGSGGTPARLNLTAQEKAALVDFMETLTDNAFLTDVKFSDPFPFDPTNSPKDTWNPFINLANRNYTALSASGDTSNANAQYFYYRAIGYRNYFSSIGNWGASNYHYYLGLGYYLYYAINGQSSSLYYLYLYTAYANYYYHLGSGDSVSANSAFDYYYSLAIGSL